ncbi:MAG TPA: hypothetical protein VMW04_03650 [Patescibacteria group bacterium]|nr:hypothetical protein [Patescibacteria group bacterium]
MATLPEKELPLPGSDEKFPVTVEGEPKIAFEVESLVKKLEKEDTTLTQPVADDSGQPLVSPAAPLQPQIVLPLTSTQYAFGLKQRVSNSIRWLSEWCFRLVKIFGPRAIFQQTETEK